MAKKIFSSGPLSESLEPVYRDKCKDDADYRMKFQALQDKKDENLKLLLAHYNIPDVPGMYYMLSMRLAADFVPGLSLPKGRGPRTKWTEARRAILVVEVERVMRGKGTGWGEQRAAKLLAKQEPWASLLRSNDSLDAIPDPGGALHAQYKKIKSAYIAKEYRMTFKDMEERDALHEWDVLVDRQWNLLVDN